MAAVFLAFLARRLTAETRGAIRRYFGGVSTAAISKTVQRAEARRIDAGIGSWRNCWQDLEIPGIPQGCDRRTPKS